MADWWVEMKVALMDEHSAGQMADMRVARSVELMVVKKVEMTVGDSAGQKVVQMGQQLVN